MMDDIGPAIIVVVLYALLIGLIVVAFIRCCRVFAKAMNDLPDEFRPFNGHLAWLGMIPCLGYLWLVIFGFILSHSYKRAFDSFGPHAYDTGRNLAIGWVVVAGIAIFAPGIFGTILGLIGLLLMGRFYRQVKAMHENLLAILQESPDYHGTGDLQSYSRPRDDI